MARYGLAEFIKIGVRFFKTDSSAFSVGFVPPSVEPSSDVLFELPNAYPGSSQALIVSPAGVVTYGASGGGGIAGVTLNAPSAVFDIAGNGTDTLTLTFDSQTQNKIFASPNGSSGTPVFRAIAWGDVSGLVGTSGASFAVGNDSRFHSQNTDVSTTANAFLLDSTGTGLRLKVLGDGSLELRNAADTATANLVVNGLITKSTVDVQSETVNIADNVIVLNSNVVSGTPTENAGLLISRGSSVSASFIWDESNDRFVGGLAGSEIAIARYKELTFVTGDLVAGVLTVAHGLARQYPPVSIIKADGKRLGNPDNVTYTDSNTLAVDLSSFTGFSGTWIVSVG